MLHFRHTTVLIPLLLLLPLHAQQQPQHPPQPPSIAAPPSATNTLSVRVQVVAINAVVRDSKDNLVRGLDKTGFNLRVDNHPYPIRYFNSDSDLPLTIGLMVDTSGSQHKFVDEERRASAIFLQDMITEPHDRAFLVRFDNFVLLLQKLTPDVAKLQHALGMLYSPYTPAQHLRGGTLLFDAICSTAKQVFGDQPGRRALVILTDGEDNGSAASLDQAIQQAQFADIAVYGVLYTDNPSELSNSDYKYARHSGRAVLEQISNATGGRLFVVRKNMPIDHIYAEIEAELRTQYRFGFTPPASAPLQYHTIELRSVNKKFTVQARTGYYSPK